MSALHCRIVPSRRLLTLLFAPVVLLLVFPNQPALAFVLVYDIVLIALVLTDAAMAPRVAQLVVSREMATRLSMGAENRVGWQLRNLSPHPIHFELLDDLPATFAASPAVVRGVISAQSHTSVFYQVRPTRRGLHRVGDVHLRFRSLLGLLVKQARFTLATEVRVYPNVLGLARHELAARKHRLAELGLTPKALRGEGKDFESLRDYVPGDNPIDIAWKATARRGRIITRNYQAERSQNVLVVLDCGRLMTTEVAGITRLDHAINAALLLSYVTVKQGDYIGLLAFSNDVETYLPPVRGRAALGRMNEALYRLEPRPCEANYERACQFLALRHRKRSLIVIVSDVVDNDASSTLLAYAARFARYHLPLCVTLKNLDVERLANAEPRDESAPFTQAVALDLLHRRRIALEEMRRAGVDVLDVAPTELGPRLITRYLELKHRVRI